MNDKFTLSQNDYNKAIDFLDIELPTLKAVAKIESLGNGFTKSHKPIILFEGHVFWKELSKRNLLNKTLSTYKNIENILYKSQIRKYYKNGDDEWVRLNKAKEINEEAAICSTSYGMFQIMGFNYDVCLCTSVLEYEVLNFASAKEQLLLFCKYIQTKKLTKYLKDKNWKAFAFKYNGSGYTKNKYDILLEKYYFEFKNQKHK